MLYTERDRYDVGDILQANCTTAPSRPNADINFYINDIPVSEQQESMHFPCDVLISSRLCGHFALDTLAFLVSAVVRCGCRMRRMNDVYGDRDSIKN